MIPEVGRCYELQVKKLDPRAIVPSCAHPGADLGFDLYALETTELPARSVTRVRTGVAMHMESFGFRIADRSSMAMRGLHVVGGVIDEGYTGEMFMNLANGKAEADKVLQGDRIAQIIPQEIFTRQPVVVVDALPESARGEKGYGSTGR